MHIVEILEEVLEVVNDRGVYVVHTRHTTECRCIASCTTKNSVEIAYISDINLQCTFNKSVVKIDLQMLFPCVHVILVISSASLNLFSRTFTGSLFAGYDRWKMTACKKATLSPQLDLLADWPEK